MIPFIAYAERERRACWEALGWLWVGFGVDDLSSGLCDERASEQGVCAAIVIQVSMEPIHDKLSHMGLVPSPCVTTGQEHLEVATRQAAAAIRLGVRTRRVQKKRGAIVVLRSLFI